jgi:hypothetical protein
MNGEHRPEGGSSSAKGKQLAFLPMLLAACLEALKALVSLEEQNQQTDVWFRFSLRCI